MTDSMNVVRVMPPLNDRFYECCKSYVSLNDRLYECCKSYALFE